MSVLNNSNDDVVECPLCMEPLEVDDLSFYPCTCGYQICRFCWHRIRTDENELCPACRKAYPENPADFKPLSQEQISALKAEKRQRDQQRKQKISENRKHLANVRVVQKNLVFVVGLPPRLADAEILKKHEYFGKYGKIHKVVINPSTTYAGVQGPSASAYVTYCSNNDALRAIQSVNNIMIDGRLIKTSLGTTKYCSHFMKNQSCPKPDCMYLHELGDLEASFTKEEMHNGKHQEYEKRLHDALIAATAAAAANSTTNTTNNNNNNSTTPPSPNGKLSESNKQTPTDGTQTQNGPEKGKEAWPSLSISPTNKETNGKAGKNSNKENGGKKSKAEKNKNKKSASTNSNGSSNSSSSTNGANSTGSITSVNSKDSGTSSVNGKDAGFNTKDSNTGESPKQTMSADEELNLLSEIENDASSNDMDGKADTPSLSLSTSGDSGTISDSVSGKSSPANFSDHTNENGHTQTQHDVDKQQNKANLEKNSFENFGTAVSSAEINTNCHPLTSSMKSSDIDTATRFTKLALYDDNNSFFSSNTFQPSPFFKLDNTPTTQLRNLESTNQTNSPQLPDLLSGTESDKERQDMHDKLNILKGLSDFASSNSLQNGCGSTSNAFDELQKRRNLVNGLGLHSTGLIEDSGMDFFGNPSSEQSRFSQLTQQTQNLHNQRTQPPTLQNSLHSSDSSGLGHQVYANNLSKFFDFHKNQQQQQQQQQQFASQQQQLFMSDQMNVSNLIDQSRLMDARRLNSQYLDQQNSSNNLLGNQFQKLRLANTQLGMNASQMQQQQQQQQCLNNVNLFHSNNNPQNSRLQSFFQQPHQQPQQPQPSQTTSIDDELDFDPFFETQKGLAELIENEQQQQSNQSSAPTSVASKLLDNSAQQRCRLPPPGFSHMNAFGLGVPRAATQTSKILPFMNSSGNGATQSQPSHNWPHHSGQPQPNLNYGIHDQMSNLLSKQNHLANKSSFGNTSDWSLIDPAIVSFRPYQSFMSGPPPQQSQNDMFMSAPHMAQQQQQQQQQMNGQFDSNKLKSNEFPNRNNLMQSSYGAPHGLNLQNGIMSQQQQANSQQVNFSHSNWLNSDQSQNNLFMNHNLSNGFANNFDKYTIPIPPGFSPATLPKQKTECIN